MEGRIEIDHRCNEESDDDDDVDSVGKLLTSPMSATVVTTMRVIEYVCNLQGVVSNDRNNTPLMYGVERTGKSETEGLYFVLTHSKNLT